MLFGVFMIRLLCFEVLVMIFSEFSVVSIIWVEMVLLYFGLLVIKVK